ncbi:Proteinaceous RNase P 1, chloroplastic/mitochondrial [Turnera subulata]|uniref:ribonuclease P n=1 Tax=Turnera subulata TaxID=218843 RepID=A0A9Q0FJ53_9ROSI|nr:Proteinaceous RNase P 1, chloroplastic/mitochondrial [Turnera subulata]
MLRRISFMSSFNKPSALSSFFVKTQLLCISPNNCRKFCRPVVSHSSYFIAPPVDDLWGRNFSMVKRANLCSLALAAKPPLRESSASATNTVSKKATRKALRDSPEGVLRKNLDMCSKHGDIVEALRLYDEARNAGVKLSQHHYNVLLYLCASSASSVESSGDGSDTSKADLSLKRGFEILQQMLSDKIVPNEATFTNVSRLAVAMENPEMAFDLVKEMQNSNIQPRLRSYGPALFGFCKKGMVDKAYEVDAHMIESGVAAEEPEISSLLKVSADANKAEKVYEMLHRLRTTTRQVTDSTAGIIEDWFKSEYAGNVGEENWEVSKIKQAVVRGGGGWHGQGWLGSGQWKVARTCMDQQGVCQTCHEKLVCIDIDPKETENFATSLANLAFEREGKADFFQFQEWLQRRGPFDAVIDGANMGLANQRSFNFYQLNTVVNKMRQMSPSKRLPLVILHRSRVTGGPAQNPNNQKLLENWRKSGALFATPPGSNDDWYWLYAAVSSKCLLVTNDEMRDHLFQLLGTSFFPRWKEKHQVRITASQDGISLHMPPPYSIVIQESENGSWHVPTTVGDDLETPRQWLCATRPRNN